MPYFFFFSYLSLAHSQASDQFAKGSHQQLIREISALTSEDIYWKKTKKLTQIQNSINRGIFLFSKFSQPIQRIYFRIRLHVILFAFFLLLIIFFLKGSEYFEMITKLLQRVKRPHECIDHEVKSNGGPYKELEGNWEKNKQTRKRTESQRTEGQRRTESTKLSIVIFFSCLGLIDELTQKIKTLKEIISPPPEKKKAEPKSKDPFITLCPPSLLLILYFFFVYLFILLERIQVALSSEPPPKDLLGVLEDLLLFYQKEVDACGAKPPPILLRCSENKISSRVVSSQLHSMYKKKTRKLKIQFFSSFLFFCYFYCY